MKERNGMVQRQICSIVLRNSRLNFRSDEGKLLELMKGTLAIV
jgi:hypothetical protein